MKKNDRGFCILECLMLFHCAVSILDYFISLPDVLEQCLSSIYYIGILVLYLFKIRKIEYKIEYGLVLLSIINLVFIAISFI